MDISINSSGLTKYNDVTDEYSYLGFYPNQTKIKKEFPGIITYNPDSFSDQLDKFIFMQDHIFKFLEDVDVAAIEGYSYGGSGQVFNISEFTGGIKQFLHRKKVKVEIYAPSAIKKSFTDFGHSDKISMYEKFLSLKNKPFDISMMPIVKIPAGCKPTSDLIDSFAILNLLRSNICNIYQPLECIPS